MKALFLDEKGEERPIIMGCYGIGVGRTVAAAIEQNHDDLGIVWPAPIAPFDVALVPLQMHEAQVRDAAQGIYNDLMARGADVLLDDRDERPGVKFNDADLLGAPIRVTVGSRSLKAGQVEVKLRSRPEVRTVPLQEAPALILETLKDLHDSAQ
jgi:prolyl-tRNA synthetase